MSKILYDHSWTYAANMIDLALKLGKYQYFSIILGPYVQYCPCEASEQKLAEKPKSELMEKELVICL